ncbi:MAG TPA: methyltransferase domain-containing protein, partial [Marinagarivorans sp.]
MKDIAYIDRACDCCGGDDLHSVWQYEKISKTRNEQFRWKVNNVVCKQCGFAFVSPVPTQQSLTEYYSDSFSIFTGQEVDYSIDNRLAIIQACQAISSAQSFLEVGSNNSPEFQRRLSELFSRIETVEINDDCNSTYKNLHSVPAQSQDIVASYFALEHIPNPEVFLRQCAALLKNDGCLIIEVPN